MGKSGYIYKITEIASSRIYLGLRMGVFDKYYFGSPGKSNDLHKIYVANGIIARHLTKDEKSKNFEKYFTLEVIEESYECQNTPEWCEDKSLTLEGAYKKYKYPECLSSNGGFNKNIDRKSGFPFVEPCSNCSGTIGSHRKECPNGKTCDICNGNSGKHKSSCSLCVKCSICGTKNQNHKKDIGNGNVCPNFNDLQSKIRSEKLKIWATTEGGQALLSKMGKTNKGKKKPAKWIEWRREEFSQNNPMSNPATVAKVKETRRAKLKTFIVACKFCGKENERHGADKRIFCSRVCMGNNTKKINEEKRNKNNSDFAVGINPEKIAETLTKTLPQAGIEVK